MPKRFIPLFWGLVVFVFLVSAQLAAQAAEPQSGQFSLQLRSRQESAKKSGQYHLVTQPETWDAEKSAVIVCDMWDTHHSQNAAKRTAELAPRMNRVLLHAREKGATIIHAPSGCMDHYENHPARQRVAEVPRSENLPEDIGQWCHQIPAEERGKYPLDQTDADDDDPDELKRFHEKLRKRGRNPKRPWKFQIATLEIQNEDYISDDGKEIWSILEHHGIKNVILVGVHTNMCVLGRPFGLRQMAKNGKHVVLMRDMTDTMYNPKKRPFVSHFTGTDLIVEHIEKFVCPTVTSDQLLGGKPFRFKGDQRKRLVMIIAEREYRTNESLPPFALEYLGHDFSVDFVFADPKDRNKLMGIGLVEDADVLLISVRRRALPKEQLAVIKQFVEAGKPVVGIRTASHAFALRNGSPPEGRAVWPEFDHDVLGGNYHGHYGGGPKVQIEANPEATDHPILHGVKLSKLAGHGSLYQTKPLTDSATLLLSGSIPGQESEPIAWTNRPKTGNRVFYTSLGHIEEFQNAEFQKLLRNAITWAAYGDKKK